MTERVNITIIGLGRIGVSMGLALKQAENVEIVITGHDKEPNRTQQALRRKAIDKGDWNLPRSVEKADLVILALPLSEIRDTLTYIADVLRPNAVVTDTAILKAPVLLWAKEILPQNVHFVGGHPIVRDIIPDVDAARADIFRGEVYVVCTTVLAQPKAVKLVTNMINLLGARPLFMDPQEHDALIAGVEQAPYVLAMVLTHAVTQSSGWSDMRKLAGAQLEASTFTASTDPADLALQFQENREHLLSWIDLLQRYLAHWRQLIEEESPERVEEVIETLMTARREWIEAALKGKWEEESPAERGFPLASWLFGEFLIGRRRKRPK